MERLREMSARSDEKEEKVRSLGGLILNAGSSLKNALANSINQFSNITNWSIFTEIKDYKQARVISNKLALAYYLELDVIVDREKDKLVLMKNKGRKMEDAFVRIHNGMMQQSSQDDVDKNVGVKKQLNEFLGGEDQ